VTPPPSRRRQIQGPYDKRWTSLSSRSLFMRLIGTHLTPKVIEVRAAHTRMVNQLLPAISGFHILQMLGRRRKPFAIQPVAHLERHSDINARIKVYG